MNAKKIVLLAAAGMMLASCGTSLTRADAIAAMDAISKVQASATAVNYKFDRPAEGNATGVVGYTEETYSSEKHFAYMVESTKETKDEQWLYVKDETVYAVMASGDEKAYAKLEKANDIVIMGTSIYNTLLATISEGIETGINAALAAGKSAANKSNPYGFCGFLAQFPEGDALFTAGTGTLPTCKIIGESYTKFGEGSLKATYNAKYDGQDDEVYTAEWKDNRIVALSNAKTSSASGYGFKTWKYDGDVKVSYPDLASFEEIDIMSILG